jgi:hypothetical protein
MKRKAREGREKGQKRGRKYFKCSVWVVGENPRQLNMWEDQWNGIPSSV